MANDLVRFSVAMPEDLLMRFDQLVARRGLVRDALVEDDCGTPGVVVMGTLTVVFDHHAHDVQEKMHHIQHLYYGNIVSTTHVHINESQCLEVIILKGETGLVQDIANMLLGTKGVSHGNLTVTTTGCVI